MKAITRSWNQFTEEWEEREPMFNGPIPFLTQLTKVNPDMMLVESPSIMGGLCRTFTWHCETVPGTYVVINATKKVTTARLFRKHQLRAEHIWYH